MTTGRARVALVLGVALLIAAGYATYTYLKRSPPPWLIQFVTRTEPPPPLPAGDLAPFTVPQGYVATIYARDVTGARVMARDPKGALLVSQTSAGRIVALPDLDSDGKADEAITVLEGLKQPHGIAIICPDTGSASADQDACRLYVAETGELKSYRYDADTYAATYESTLATFPTGRGHFTRTLLRHPDGRLLISVGSSCNVCSESDPMRASIQALNLETGAMSAFATGLRNSVFLALHPVTSEVWATDNGRDILGDDIPPDEINIIREGQNYGWPVCYGKNVYDTDFDARAEASCGGLTPSHIDLPAHAAALGLSFVPEEGWPEAWRNDLIVAMHGSWNRSTPSGYKVVRIDLDDQGTFLGMEDFVTGFLPSGGTEDDAIGRPVGVLAEPGGVVYVSDDRANAIYRIVRQ